MKSMPKWLLIPPVVALLAVLGPLSMQGGSTPSTSPGTSAPATAPAQPTTETGTQTPRSNRPTIVGPRTPDLVQMGSALIGVLLLGVVGVMLLRKLRGGATPTRASNLAVLRQSLRLGARQSVHAIEFDDRILLVGENERGLVLLDSGKLPERAADEAEVLARQAQSAPAPEVDEDEGATPRNLLIPRPEVMPARRLPTPPAAAPAPAKRATPGLNDFRNLLQKAGRA